MTLQIRAIPRHKPISEPLSAKLGTMTLQIRAIPRLSSLRIEVLFPEYHDITNPGNPQTWNSYHWNQAVQGVPWHYKSGQSPDKIPALVTTSWSTMTLQIRAIPRHFCEDENIVQLKKYHDITNPGNPQTKSEEERKSSTSKYHDITNPGNPQTIWMAIKWDRYSYHDITNPGNPQTWWQLDCRPWASYHDITNPGNPQTCQDRQNKIRRPIVPWHYKSGQSPDKKPLTIKKLTLSTMTLQIRAIPRPKLKR